MSHTALEFSSSQSPAPSATAVATADLPHLIEEWLLDCEFRQHARRTNETRRGFCGSFVWFLKHRNFQTCGLTELKQL